MTGNHKVWFSVDKTDLEPADPAALSGVVAGRYLGLDPSSEAHFQLAAHWIEDCVRNHIGCSLNVTSTFSSEQYERQPSLPSRVINAGLCPLPTRVIDVGSLDGKRSPFLYETGHRLGTYVTLSHCWGNTSTLTTTAITLEDRKSGIELSKVSRTFRDAIRVTQKLGLQYLWIDALCIIQDSSDDWQHESSHMGKIYRDALFTISATGALDGDGGCFLRRPALPLDSVKIDCHLGDGTSCKISFRLQTDHSDTKSVFDDGKASPVNDRAWCLQERLLSRRILHYGKELMYWECHEHSLLEDGSKTDGWSGIRQNFDVVRTCNLDQISQADADRVKYNIYERWRALTRRYTARKLTRGSDKLPGLSGVATMIHALTGDKFLAGLWREDLPRALMWRTWPGESLARPAKYRAPSWSWASVEGEVLYVAVDDNISTAVDILEAETELLGHDRHGQVTGGWIKIRGPLLFATTAAGKKPESGPTDILDEAGNTVGSCYFDVEGSGPRQVACLMVPLDNYPHVRNRALILGATGNGPDEYRRLGIGNVRIVSGAVERRTVIIV